MITYNYLWCRSNDLVSKLLNYLERVAIATDLLFVERVAIYVTAVIFSCSISYGVSSYGVSS